MATQAGPGLPRPQRIATVLVLLGYAGCPLAAWVLGPDALGTRLVFLTYPLAVVGIAWHLARHAPLDVSPPSMSIVGRPVARMGWPKPWINGLAGLLVVGPSVTRRMMSPGPHNDLWVVAGDLWWWAGAAFILFGIPRLITPRNPEDLSQQHTF